MKIVYFELVGINQPTLLSQIDHEITHFGLIRDGYRRLPRQKRKHQGVEPRCNDEVDRPEQREHVLDCDNVHALNAFRKAGTNPFT